MTNSNRPASPNMTAEKLAELIAMDLDAEMVGDWDITATVHARRLTEVLVWVDNDSNGEGTSFIVHIGEEA